MDIVSLLIQLRKNKLEDINNVMLMMHQPQKKGKKVTLGCLLPTQGFFWRHVKNRMQNEEEFDQKRIIEQIFIWKRKK